MASRIQSRDPTPTTTAIACLVAVMAWILIGSIYVGNTAGWPQFILSVFSAVTVCAVGASSLVYAAYQQFVVKHSLFADPDRRGDFNYRSTGQWAVVTGATDGIGKEYARQLAANYGMDVVLVGRNPDKLRAVAGLIRKECGGLGRRVTTVVADFAEDPVAARGQRCGGGAVESTTDRGDGPGLESGENDGGATAVHDDVGDRCFCDDDDDDDDDDDGGPFRAGRGRCTRWYPRLRAVVEGLSSDGGVGVLINCAGVCYPHPEYFAGMSGRDGDDGGAGRRRRRRRRPEEEFTAGFCDNADAAVRCNVAAAVHACRLVLPGMLARGRGLIVNVGSAAASMPPAAPLMTLYSATKKFLEKLSADLDAECAYLTRDRREDGSFGVRVQCARPAYVVTAMLRSANPDVRAVSGDDGSDGGESDGDDGDGDRSWWAARRKRVEDGIQRWMVPSARRWVRSALRQGGRLYARGDGSGPANFTGYWPHTLLVWCGKLASALTPHRWFINRVLIPGMLVYRAKGRSATSGERAVEET